MDAKIQKIVMMALPISDIFVFFKYKVRYYEK